MKPEPAIVLKPAPSAARRPLVVLPADRGDLVPALRELLGDALVLAPDGTGSWILGAGDEEATALSRTDWIGAADAGWRLRVAGPTRDPQGTLLDASSWAAPELRVREDESDPGTRHALQSEDHFACVIGRATDCEVPIDSLAASRRHCRVSFRAGAFRVEDLGSRHGTFVGDERVDRPRVLRHGDVIRAGDSRIEFTWLARRIEQVSASPIEDDFPDLDPYAPEPDAPRPPRRELGEILRQLDPRPRLRPLVTRWRGVRADQLVAAAVIAVAALGIAVIAVLTVPYL